MHPHHTTYELFFSLTYIMISGMDLSNVKKKKRQKSDINCHRNNLTFTLFIGKGQKLKSLVSCMCEYKQKNILNVKICCYCGSEILMRCCYLSVKLAVPKAVKPLTGLKTTIILNRQTCELRDQAVKSFSFLFLLNWLKYFKITQTLHVKFTCLIFLNRL